MTERDSLHLDRRQALSCMVWAGSGVVWTIAGGIPASRLIGEESWPKQVLSAEGDEVVFSKAHYEVLDEEALRHALDTSKSMVRDDDDHYGWVDEKEDASAARRAFGHLEIANGELILECQTRQRLERGKELLRHLAGEALRHKGDDFRGWKSALRDR